MIRSGLGGGVVSSTHVVPGDELADDDGGEDAADEGRENR